MPKRYRKKRQKRKSRLGRILSKYPARNPKWSQQLPAMLQTCLVYNDRYQLTSSVTKAVQHFQINSIFDPDQTGVGQQPRAYDTLILQYDRYRVVACAWEITWTPETSSIPAVCTAVQLNSGAFNNSVDYQEAAGSQTIVLGHANGQGSRTMKGVIDCASTRGMRSVRGEDTLQALFNATPADPINLGLCVESFDLSSTATVAVNVRLKMYVECFERNNPAAST